MSSEDGMLVLTTREKHWWLSMQEIIPAIDRVWEGIGQSVERDVRMFCMPLTAEAEQLLETAAAGVKRIVITSATPETIRIALLLRVNLKVEADFILYVSGDSTEGFHNFGALVNVLTERDIFVVSCEAEAIGTRCCFPNATVHVIPFPLVDRFKLGRKPHDRTPETTRLAYVGRVSEQKNLHTLLFALWILHSYHKHSDQFTLDVYGGVDNLGSPNMGIEFAEYDIYLQRLAEKLNIDHLVTWHNFKPRDWLFDNVHLTPHILVSPTLHSDENFGSSVLASLVNGHQVVTTAWGGHFGFQDLFPGQLTLVPVGRSAMGPVLDPFVLADKLLQSMRTMPMLAVEKASLDRATGEFSDRNVIKLTLDMLDRPLGEPVALPRSPTLHHIDQTRAHFGGARRIYESYEDPVAQIFFEAYGMKGAIAVSEQYSSVLPPWVSYGNSVLTIADPHRGQQSLSVDSEETDTVDVVDCPGMNKLQLPRSLFNALLTKGYVFSPTTLQPSVKTAAS